MSRANFIRTMILLAAAVSVSGCYYMPTNGPTSSDVVAGRGFAHGFVVLSETADFFYKCDDFYSPKDELSIRWNDPAIGIKWGVFLPGSWQMSQVNYCWMFAIVVIRKC